MDIYSKREIISDTSATRTKMIGDRTAGLGLETLEICRLLYSTTLGARTQTCSLPIRIARGHSRDLCVCLICE